MLQEGNGKFEARNPGKSHLFSCLDQPSAKLQIMILFPVLIPGQNFLFPGTGNYKMPREGKFEACIPESHAKREFPLTSASKVPLLNLQKVKEPRPPASQLKKRKQCQNILQILGGVAILTRLGTFKTRDCVKSFPTSLGCSTPMNCSIAS